MSPLPPDRLPGGEHAYVPPEKIRDYLLSASHPVVRWKARFFASLGFSVERADELERILLSVAVNGTVVETESTMHGIKFVVDGEVGVPRGGTVPLRTIWIAEARRPPRLVTAYPIAPGDGTR